MDRVLLAALLLAPILLRAQTTTPNMPVFLGQTVTMLPPTVDGHGQTIVFGSAIIPDGTNLGTMNLYAVAADGSGLRQLSHLTGIPLGQPKGANAVSFSANGARAAYTALGPTTQPQPVPVTGPAGEEVHLVDVATGADRTVAVDTGGCIQPLAPAIFCISCFFTCVNAPHITDDSAKVLYSVSRSQPFYIVNADGTGLTHLPVYNGALAPAPQRVISQSGLVVFTSPSPTPPALGPPTVGPYVQDVYVMNLDGTNIQNVTKFGNNTPLPAPFSAFNALFLSNATISADGGTIVFEGTPQTTTGTGGIISSSEIPVTQIWLVHSDGSALRALTTGSDSSYQPSVSGDGSLVAFARGGQVSIVHSDGTGLKALTNFQMSAARNPVISQDGSLVVFALGPSSGGIGAIYAVNSDGSHLHAVYAPRTLNQNGVTGTIGGTAPSPGSLFSAYGMNLSADSITSAGSFPLPQTMAGLSLLVNGQPAPLVAVTPWQVNAQLAPDFAEGPAAFQFRFADGTTSSASAADVKSFAPAIFILPSPPCPPGTATPAPPNGQPVVVVACPIISQAAAFHANSAVPADQAHPAAAGEVLEIYGTGLGLTDPPVPARMPAPASPPARTLTIPQVLIGNIMAQVTFAGLTPGFAGLYQVNVVVPSGLRPGQQSVQWRVGTTMSNFATITVE